MTIIYAFDPLCGWCYGFTGVIDSFYNLHKDQFNFEVLSGGMVRGEQAGPIGEVAAYISQAYKAVEDRTGVRFGEAFLEGTLPEGKAMFSSVPPSQALQVIKAQKPAEALAFAEALQKAIYYDGMHPDDQQGLAKLAQSFGLDAQNFLLALNSPEIAQKTVEEFERVSQLGVTGFPTLLLLKEGQYQRLAEGYLPLEELEKRIASSVEP